MKTPEEAASILTLNEYRKFAPYYREIGIRRGHFNSQITFLKSILNNYSDAIILDASCATGDVLNELSINYSKFFFYGSDFCHALLDQAQTLSNNSNLIFKNCSWNKLTNHFNAGFFDIIYILGNSISHAPSFAELKNVFINVKHLLKRNGLFVFDIRPWTLNIEQSSFNGPLHLKTDTLQLNNSIRYETSYMQINKRHNLIHKLYNSISNALIDEVKLSFLDMPESEIKTIAKSCGFEIQNTFEKCSNYPFLAYLLKNNDPIIS